MIEVYTKEVPFMKTALNSLAFATIAQLRAKLANKEITEKELLQYYLERFKKYNPDLNAAYEVFDEQSILHASEQKGILAGIPGLIKDNISQKDRELTCGSKILQGFRATYDATAISRLKQEGGLLVGRANMDEFG